MNGSRVEGISFDLFDTLVAVEKPADPAGAVAAELAAAGVSVPDDWHAAFAEYHLDVADGREISLSRHVAAALSSRRDSIDPADVRAETERAVLAAFEAEVRTRPGAARTVDSLVAGGPVGVLSNCSVPGLAERVLHESAIDETAFAAVVTSVGCGWRKPHPRAFSAVADELGVGMRRVLHVGDDPTTDGRADEVGAESLLVSDVALADLPDTLAGRWG